MTYELLALLLAVISQGLYLAYRIGKFEQKLDVIEQKQDKYNGVIEKTYCNVRDISVLQEQIKVSNHRMDDLEQKFN